MRAQPAPLPEIEMVERARAHADEHLARREHRIRRVLVAEDVGPAVLMEADGFHRIVGSGFSAP